MASYKVELKGGSPWGFRLKGGRGTGLPLVVSKINPGSKAAVANISIGDSLERINNQLTDNLDHHDALDLIRDASSSLELVLSASKLPLNGPTSINNNSTMSVQTSTGIAGQQNVSNFDVDDETVSVDGVTFHGFSPSNVSVTRTTTTKVTKTTRSRSPSPSGSRTHQVENVTAYPTKQTTVRYDSEPENEEMPVKFMSGVVWTPPGSKGMLHPHSVVIPVRSNASRKATSPWKPVTFRPQSKDDSMTFSLATPPVPPPPPESDSEDVPPIVPPIPKVVRRKLYLSANQPQETLESPVEQPTSQMIAQNNNNKQYPSSAYYEPRHPSQPESYHPAPDPHDSAPNQHHQPVRPQRANSDAWPTPPPPLVAAMEAQPQHAASPPTGGTSPPKHGVWSPASQSTAPQQYQPIGNKAPAAWKPVSPDAQPVKEFRPVRLDLGAPQQQHQASVPPMSTSPKRSASYQPPQPITNGDLHSPGSYHPYEQPPPPDRSTPYRPANPHADQERYNPGYQAGSEQPRSPQEAVRSPEIRPVPEGYSSNLPRSVSPMATLLQYQRDTNDLPEGAVYQKQTIDGDVVHTDTYYPVKTREVTTKTVHKDAPRYEGIGPKDETGLPVGLRAHVKEENRHDWYKEMFKTIHKQDRPEDDIPPGYMDALIKEANMYEPSYRFPDEVSLKNDDQWSHDPTLNASPPRSPNRKISPNASARNTIDRYHQQPRSIIDYEPGKSSLVGVDQSPSAMLYNPPLEPIAAVQNTKRSTTLPRDFAQFNQVPAESPSSRHGSHGSHGSQGKDPSKREEPIRSSSRPLSASTLPKSKVKSRSLESSGLSAAERLGVKTLPPQRTHSTGSKPARHSSGSDKIYNYRDPPPTLDKTKAERLIEEERKKKERLQLEDQKQRRHSDYASIKSPIITNDRFRDPVISAHPKQQGNRKQEIKACAIALYEFDAQSHKELAFEKGDIIYLLRAIDKNWYEGEHHGHAGIFPASYVEVVTSLEDAKKAQLHGPGLEGKARGKYKFAGETQMELYFNKGDYIELTRKVDENWWEGHIGNRKGIFPTAYVEVLREPTGTLSPPDVKSPTPMSQAPIQPVSQQVVQSNPTQQQRPQDVSTHQVGRPLMDAGGGLGSYPTGQREPERYYDKPAPQPSKTLAAGQDLYVASFAYVPQNEDEVELREGDLVNVLEKCSDGWFVGMSERTGMFGTFPGNYVHKHET